MTPMGRRGFDDLEIAFTTLLLLACFMCVLQVYLVLPPVLLHHLSVPSPTTSIRA